MPHSTFSSPMQTPHTQQTAPDLKNLLVRQSMEERLGSRKQFRTFISKKAKQEQELFDRIVFAKKKNTKNKVRVVSLGS